MLVWLSAIKHSNTHYRRPSLQLFGQLLETRGKLLAVSTPTGIQLQHPHPVATGYSPHCFIVSQTCDTRSRGAVKFAVLGPLAPVGQCKKKYEAGEEEVVDKRHLIITAASSPGRNRNPSQFNEPDEEQEFLLDQWNEGDSHYCIQVSLTHLNLIRFT